MYTLNFHNVICQLNSVKRKCGFSGSPFLSLLSLARYGYCKGHSKSLRFQSKSFLKLFLFWLLFCNQFIPQDTINQHSFLYPLDSKWAGWIGQNQIKFLTLLIYQERQWLCNRKNKNWRESWSNLETFWPCRGEMGHVFWMPNKKSSHTYSLCIFDCVSNMN